jgi:hypothetical protein
MNKRTSLFDLEATLPRLRERRPIRPARTAPGVAGRRPPRREPARPGMGTAASRESAVQVRSFDDGAPLCCEHDVQYPPVERPRIPSAVEPDGTPPTVAAPPPAPRPVEPGPDGPRPVAPAAIATARELTVEAFEDEDGPTDPEIDPPTMTGDEPAITEPTIEDPDAAGIERIRRAAMPATARASAMRGPLAFARERDEAERDLAELTARVNATQPTPLPRPPAPAAPPPPAPSGPDPEFVRRKAMLDEMAKGMSYATEFRLPPVQLARVFSALDEKLDAESAPAGAAAPPAPGSPPAPAPTAPADTTVPPLPSTDQLISDLVGLVLPAKPPAADTGGADQPAADTPGADEPTAGRPADATPTADDTPAVMPVMAPPATAPDPAPTSKSSTQHPT